MENLINESLAQRAKENCSFDDYKQGSTTEEFNRMIETARKYLKIRLDECETEQQKDGYKEIFEKYEKSLAYAINEDNRIGAMLPSVMITGAGNYPMKKHERQMEAYRSNQDNFKKAEYYLDRLKYNYSNNTVQSDDPEVLTALKNKLEKLESIQQKMKDTNAYYRKNGSLQGCECVSAEFAKKFEQENKSNNCFYQQPFMPFELTNNNAKIHNVKKRIESLSKVKEHETKQKDFGNYAFVENTEIMRFQFLFNGKPSEEIRSLLKYNGFRWAPSQNAWQRQITVNGKHAARRVMDELNKKRRNNHEKENEF